MADGQTTRSGEGRQWTGLKWLRIEQSDGML
jgi:hypothetical protein